MEYIDGGWDIISVKLAGAIFNTAISIATGGLGASGYVAIFGRNLAAKHLPLQ